MYSAHAENALAFADRFGCKSVDLKSVGTHSDIIIIAVPDESIGKIAIDLKYRNQIIVHTSGSVSIDVFNGLHQFGVLYPLQTFTRDMEIDLTDVPFCIEASDPEVVDSLKSLAHKLSNSVVDMNSQLRKDLHIAAVTVNNFSNHLYHLASDYLKENGLSFDLLKPLIMETARKISDISPEEAQTGPAKRGDIKTIEEHAKMIEKDLELKKVYTLFSEQILKNYHGKL